MIGAFQSGVMGQGRWTPAYMTTALWLDAADASTITKDGSNLVSQWGDKSGGACHAIQGSGAAQPTSGTKNGLPAVLFDGVTDFLYASVTGFQSLTSVEIFILATPTAAAAADVSSFTGWGFGNIGAAVGGYPADKNLDLVSGTSTLANETIVIARYSGGRLGSTTYTRSANTSQIISTAFTTSGSAMYVNGSSLSFNIGYITAASTNITPAASGYTLDNNIFINAMRANGSPVIGPENALHEFLIVSPVSESNRNKIEGYLAHKWGLADKLPADHLYRYSPPMA